MWEQPQKEGDEAKVSYSSEIEASAVFEPGKHMNQHSCRVEYMYATKTHGLCIVVYLLIL